MKNCSGVKKQRGIKVRTIPSGSPFFRSGLRKGDRIVAVNGEAVADELDFRFSAASPLLNVDIRRNCAIKTVSLERKPGSFLDIEFYQESIGRCANKCIFCFIDQMPPGLRKRLYIKDEDLTHSFLNGNYVTLTSAGKSVLERIVSRGLSPIFVSVHATDSLVRNRMLGVRQAPQVIEQLSFLTRNGIQVHTQIVVCPGYNDKEVLAATIADLFSLGSALLSIAVVPVGLTRFRSFPLAAVDHAAAAAICRQVSTKSDKDKAREGKRRLFLADELFLKAGISVPPHAYYEDFPQIENGVGLVRQLLDNWNIAKKESRRVLLRQKNAAQKRGKRYLLLTSSSASRFMERIAREAEEMRPWVTIHVEAVENRFFGPTVTVAGLLAAQDVIGSARRVDAARKLDGVLLPPVMFNYAGYTLDGYSVERVAKKIGVPVMVVGSICDLLSI
jgi:putative radical SAM enzyme (TIGR03279 family)